jgi:glycerol-3-phosphate dehydrogenase (NAD(P)+)
MGSVTGASNGPKVAVIGAGSWGTAFGCIPASKGVQTVLWARRQELADAIATRHENPDYLAGIELPPALTATHDLEACLSDANVVVMAVPSHTFRPNFRDLLPLLPPDAPVVSLAKGIEQDTNKRMSEVLQEEADLGPSRVCVLSGPNLAKEIARGQPAATTLACADDERGRALQELFMSPTFRVYTNPDVVGCEIGGCTKNVIAIAAGIADGLGLGDNAKASLMTRGLAELARLGVAMGGNALTFAGLAGMGDLIATCTSKLSRNRHVGQELGRGRKLDDIVAEMAMVAEGVKTSRPVVSLAEAHGVDAFISEVVCQVLYGGLSPEDAVTTLMLRPPMAELEGIIQT